MNGPPLDTMQNNNNSNNNHYSNNNRMGQAQLRSVNTSVLPPLTFAHAAITSPPHGLRVRRLLEQPPHRRAEPQ